MSCGSDDAERNDTVNREIEEHFSLTGKSAVITGAGSGIGQEAARVMALAGARIVAADISPDGLAETCEMIRENNGEISSHVVDVASKPQMEDLADKALAETGGVDIWVNNAGIAPIHSIMETDPELAQRTISVNMLGAYWGCMAGARVMSPRGGGSIINMSSSGGSMPLPNMPIYGMTKAALISLTWTAAAEFGPKGIRVNAIAPGLIETPAAQALYTDENGRIDPDLREKAFSAMAERAPLGRIGTTSDIAYALVYLASPASDFVTGQVLRVNGGILM